MVERILMLVVLAVLGAVVFRLFNKTHVRRAARNSKSFSFHELDPVLQDFRGGTPGVLLFTADYCYPCKTQQQPAIQRLVEQVGKERVQYLQIDVEAHPEAAQRWGVLSLPTTFILDKGGTPRDVNHGVTSTEKLKKQIEAIA